MEYISVVETAKLIRVQLKKHFPAVKFSVKSDSYSMGASIRIHWTDGPTTKQVETITGPFAGAGFDGMIDLKYNKSSWLLPDGSVTYGHSNGSGASEPGYSEPKPCEGARLVDFGSDYVFCSRSYSELSMLKACLKVHEEYGLPLLTVKNNGYGLELEGDRYAKLPNAQNDYWSNSEIVQRTLAEMEL